MTYDEYWTGKANRVVAYRKANYKRIETKNQELWLQGFYFYNAVSVAIGEALTKKGHQSPKYLQEPINILPKTGIELKREAERERQKAIEALTAWEEVWKINHKQR